MYAIRRLVHDWPLACFLPLAFALSWYPWLIALAQGRGSGPNPLGPFAAALLVLAIGSGWPAVKALFRAMARARVGARWYALALGLPAAVVERLNTAVATVLQRPQLQADLLAAGFTPAHAGPDAFSQLIRDELARYRQMISVAGVTAE